MRRIQIIILDYSQVALSNIFQFQSDLKKDSADPVQSVSIIRHAILTGIKFYKKKYQSTYGQLVLACDGKACWRKESFPLYKAGRRAARDKTDLDWKLIFDTISQIREEIAQHFPYKVIHFDGAEGDDVIATLCKWTQTNGIIDRGMWDEKQQVMIISSDGDFKQLHKYDNVQQWSPIQKKKVECSSPQDYLHEHIAKGDSGDGIPNVLSNDDVLVTENVRQSKMTSTRLQEFIEKGRDACRTSIEMRNWDRNNTLINFDNIPASVEQSIVDIYLNSKQTGTQMGVFDYLVKHNCRLLLDDLEEFF